MPVSNRHSFKLRLRRCRPPGPDHPASEAAPACWALGPGGAPRAGCELRMTRRSESVDTAALSV